MAAIGRVLLIPKGDYSGSTAYNALDWVRDNGAAWVCKVDNTIGVAPPTLPTTSNANWQLLSADGTVSGSVDWNNVNNKPFDTVGDGLNVNASKEIELDSTYLTGSNIGYDNTTSHATSTNVQDALDELFNGGGGGGLSNAFDEVEVGGVSLVATGGDTLHLIAGSNLSITPNAGTKTLEISATGGGGSSTFAGLDDTDISSPQVDQIVQYKNVGGNVKLQNVNMPQGGHTMLPAPNASVDEAAVVSAVTGGITEGGTNDDVASLYGIGKWSNTMTKTYKIQGIAGSSTPITQSGVGTFDMTGVDQTGWVTIPALIGAGSDPSLDIKLGFDPATVSVPITLGGWVVDDSTGKMCIKFGNEIPEADTHTALITVEVIMKRTEVSAVS